MMLRRTFLPFVFLPFLAAAPPASQPTTHPANVWASLADGEVRYTQPPNWIPIPMTANPDLSIAFKNPAGNALITLNVTPERDPIPNNPNVAQALGKQILKAITADLKNSNATIVDPPKLQRDPRFLVRIHYTVQVNNITSERLHLYRALGYNLVMTIIDVDNQPPADQLKANFAVAEQLLDGVVIGKRNPKPSATRSAHKPLPSR